MKLDMFEIGSYYKEAHRFYGSKLHITERGLRLLISYDDLTEEEVVNFCKADIGITFKMYELASIIVFRFQKYLEVLPFNLFDTVSTWRYWKENKDELSLEVVICDYATGEVCGKRVENIPFSSYEHWLQVLNQFYEQNISQYTEEVLESQLREIYDNYTIDEIYEMQANQQLTW